MYIEGVVGRRGGGGAFHGYVEFFPVFTAYLDV